MRLTSGGTVPGAERNAGGSVRGLILDWGGVLTNSLASAMGAWAHNEQVDVLHFATLMRTWLGSEAEQEAAVNPVHLLERGEMEVPDFERRLADGLSDLAGAKVEAGGLLQRLFSQFSAAHDMNALVRRARGHGIRTALLSNSWGDHYPDDLFDGMFDAVVISGQVGMRKPEERIYRHTADLIRLAPTECVFVDDLPHNVEAATALGMVGVHHLDYETTSVELEAVFGIDLRS